VSSDLVWPKLFFFLESAIFANKPSTIWLLLWSRRASCAPVRGGLKGIMCSVCWQMEIWQRTHPLEIRKSVNSGKV
jgi:hypothetical protein